MAQPDTTVTITESALNSAALTVLAAVLAFAASWFWHSRNKALRREAALAEDHQKVLARLTELEARVRVADQVVTPIFTAVQTLLVQKLTHLHAPELDALLVKIGPPDVLTDGERARLFDLLHDRSWDEDAAVDADERNAAKALPLIMPMALGEQRAIREAGQSPSLKLMTIVSVVDANEAVGKVVP